MPTGLFSSGAYLRLNYDFLLRQIWSAYLSARKAMDESVAEINAQMAADKEEIANNPDYEDHLITLYHDENDAIRLIREAFTMTLHHFWEKQCLEWLKDDPNYTPEDYKFKAAYKALKSKGYTIERANLETLRLATNTIKHNSKALFDKKPLMFTKTFQGWMKVGMKKPDYASHLELTDKDLTDFHELLKRCGPPPVKTKGGITEVSL